MVLMEKFIVFPLRITSLVLCWLDLGTSGPIALLTFLALFEHAVSTSVGGFGDLAIPFIFMVFFYCGINVVLAVMLLKGIKEDEPGKMLPWIIGTGVRAGFVIICMIEFLLSSVQAGTFFSTFLPAAILVIILVYAYLAVFSYYQVLKLNKLSGTGYQQHV